MNLYRETGTFLAWYGAVMGRFTRVRPLTTITLVLSAALSRVSNLLARLLPLKVILLASSDGVPSYFQPFLAPSQKAIGLVVLATAAIFCYAANFILDAVEARLAEKGSREVVESANDIVLTDQRQQAQNNYVRATQIASDILFAGFGFSIIATSNFWLLLTLFGVFLTVFSFSAWMLRGNLYGSHRPVAAFIQDKLDVYLDILSIFCFVVGFIFVLTPFVTGSDTNVIVAMLAITFLRRTLRSVTSVVTGAVKLAGRTHVVNALIFRHHRTIRPERPESRALREHFSRRQRQKRTESELSRHRPDMHSIKTAWDDPVAGVHSFFIAAENGAQGQTRFVQRVFPRNQIQKLDNEEYLFSQIPRGNLFAPEILSRFEKPPFECQIVDIGDAQQLPLTAWKTVHPLIVEELWSCEPPRALVDAYQLSHTLLWDRLDADLFERVAIAIGSEKDEQIFLRFTEELPRILSELRDLPLCVCNPDINPRSVLQRGNGAPLIINWGRWSIEALGVEQIAMRGNIQELSALLTRVSERRSDIATPLSAHSVIRANDCANIERAIQRNMYQTALRLAGMVLFASDTDEREADLGSEEEAESRWLEAG